MDKKVYMDWQGPQPGRFEATLLPTFSLRGAHVNFPYGLREGHPDLMGLQASFRYLLERRRSPLRPSVFGWSLF